MPRLLLLALAPLLTLAAADPAAAAAAPAAPAAPASPALTAQDLKADYAYGLFTYGLYAYSTKEKDKALAAFQLATQADPTLGRAFLHLGDCLFELNKFPEAQRAYQQANTLEPDNLYSYYNLACAYARSGDPTQALASLETALQLGYNRFDKIPADPDLASLKDSPQLAALIAKYRAAPAITNLISIFLLATDDQKLTLLQLALTNPPPGWPALANKALLQSNEGLRIHGLALCHQYGGLDAIPVLIRGLFDNNGSVNKVAANALVHSGPPALPAINTLLASDEEHAKFFAKQIKQLIEKQASAAAPTVSDQLFGQPSRIVIDGRFVEIIDRGPTKDYLANTPHLHAEIDGKPEIAKFLTFFRNLDLKKLSKQASQPFFDKNTAFGTPILVKIVTFYPDGTSKEFNLVGTNALICGAEAYEAEKSDIHAFLLAEVQKHNDIE